MTTISAQKPVPPQKPAWPLVYIPDYTPAQVQDLAEAPDQAQVPTQEPTCAPATTKSIQQLVEALQTLRKKTW